MDRIFKALSDPTRRRVLQILRERPMTAGELAEKFDVSKPTMSAHFNVLRDANLIDASKSGRTITYRLKDWLTLLGFDVVGGRLDCYVPPFSRGRWIERSAFLEKAGDRWWPIGGGVYFLRATKRVQGMRIITPAWQRRERQRAFAPAGRVRETLTTTVSERHAR